MKNILITGASGGIGSEIARSLANKNNRLILIYNTNFKAITKLKEEISQNCEVAIFQCDLKDENAIKILLDEILKKYINIDVLINAAGVSLFQQVQDVTEEDYVLVMNNNFKSIVFVTKYVAKNMISNQTGKIINISSMWGKVGASLESLYSASKGAINSFTLSLAKELGPSNITVNAICPGFIETAMNKNIEPEIKEQFANSTPLCRLGAAKDVANLVEFLASDKANFITGQIICVDGGYAI